MNTQHSSFPTLWLDLEPSAETYGGVTRTVSKIVQIGVMTVIAASQDPSRPLTVSRLARLADIDRTTAQRAVQALERQAKIVPVQGGWQILQGGSGGAQSICYAPRV
jgi:hypothetical protein